jgi:hypothetical protein
MTYSSARNMVAQWVFDNPDQVDGVMWIDSDIVPAYNQVWRILSTAELHGYQILSGVYHMRRDPWEPVFYKFNSKTRKFDRALHYEPNTMYEVQGCGFGFVYTSTKAILAIAESSNFHPDGKWFPDLREGHGDYGEDLGFCYQATLTGFPVYVDTGVIVDHCGETEMVNRETYLSKLAGTKGVTPVLLA